MKNTVINENEMENVNGGGFVFVPPEMKRAIQRKHSEDSADKQDD